MASILFGTSITDARGSQGGTVFSRNRNGAYTRIKTQPINPNTIPQQLRRGQFAATAASWRGLSTKEQTTWVQNAPLYPYTNRVGVVSTYTGFQLFAKVNNQLRAVFANPLKEEVPPVVLKGMYIRSAEYAIGTPTLAILVQFGDDSNPIVPANTVFVVQATTRMSTGVNSPKANNFRTIAISSPGVDTSSVDYRGAYFNVFGTYPDPNSNVFVQVFFINTTTGQVSTKVFVQMNFIA